MTHPSPSLPNSALKALKSFRRFLWQYRLSVSLVLGAIALLSVLVTPILSAPAVTPTVQVQPSNPQLGDTLSVVIQGNSSANPTIDFNQKTYTAFPIGANRYRALLPTTPQFSAGRKPIQVMIDGTVKDLVVQLRDRTFPTQSIWLGNGGGPEGTDHEFDRVDAFKALITPDKLWNGAFRRPATGEVTSIYGVRRYYNGEFAEDYYHRGVDYAGEVGSAVVAPAGGKVVLVGRVADGFEIHGNTVGVDHGQGVISIFIHLSRIDVKEGDRVQAGQTLGGIGSTGAATGPHLHWGLYVNGLSVDPVPWRETGFE
ncbi:MAG: peptidoglycan DD-metalloendopeptidase family protein [Timaviella obliquedivisa GSE-PSE-MK23-08B]|nr:peptidoglycan DD-metalloendopeptidase family protein [Timaviella obliquedivisa GSE-PSE-MK23-08B]